MTKNEDSLYRQLVKLGDMMGDGLHLEPDGKWITTEYGKVCRALGIGPKRKRNVSDIDQLMVKRVKEEPCQKCLGKLKQTRSGSLRAVCVECGALYQLAKRAKKPKK